MNTFYWCANKRELLKNLETIYIYDIFTELN